MKQILSLSICLILAACGTTDRVRDGIAGIIETDERSTRPDRVQTVIEYVTIPSDFYDDEACPPPISLTPQEIARLVSENDYNEQYVAPLYANNETCYLGMRRIERYNDSIIARQESRKSEK